MSRSLSDIIAEALASMPAQDFTAGCAERFNSFYRGELTPRRACERCVYGSGSHAGWCEVGAKEKEAAVESDILGTFGIPAVHGIPVIVSSAVPKGTLAWVRPRRDWETDEEWARGCGMIDGIEGAD